VTRPALTALVACAALSAAAPLRAQPDPSAAQKEAERAAAAANQARANARAAGASKPAPRSGGRKVIKLDTLTVEGRIQKPEAFYVLPRSNLNFDELQKTESFVPKIEKSAQKDPF
jgi:membrane-bound lytic murein transglycosylase B